jgi:(S)-sulfolactate dehydrogenase
MADCSSTTISEPLAEIVVTEFMDEAAVAALRADFSVRYDPGLVDRPDDLVGAVARARGLIVRNRTQVRGALLAGASRLRAVGRLGVGLDNIDVEACQARGIAVLPAIGANEIAVAEYVVAVSLILLRDVYAQRSAMLAGAWPRELSIGRELAGRRMGLVGFGAIARQVAARAAAMGMMLGAHDPYVGAADPAWSGVERHRRLGDLLAVSDVVSLHVPLTAKTRGLIDAAALASMRRGAILVNTARGGIVDETALAAALRDGHLGGAALDVFAREPLGAEAAAALDCPNLILTPHVAGVTEESNVRVSLVTARNLREVLLARA